MWRIRIKTGESLVGGAYAKNPVERITGQAWGADRKNPNTSFKRGGAGTFEQPSGRWPANLILSHLPGCIYLGKKRVKGSWATKAFHAAYEGESTTHFLRGVSHPGNQHSDSEGKETVDKWDCADGCPCSTFSTARSAYPGRQDLADAHTGTPIKYSAVIDIGGSLCGKEYAESGSASRFFKQIQEEEE